MTTVGDRTTLAVGLAPELDRRPEVQTAGSFLRTKSAETEKRRHGRLRASGKKFATGDI